MQKKDDKLKHLFSYIVSGLNILILLTLFGFLLILVIANFLSSVDSETILSGVISGAGSMIGGVIGAIVAVIVVKYQINNLKKERQLENNIKYRNLILILRSELQYNLALVRDTNVELTVSTTWEKVKYNAANFISSEIFEAAEQVYRDINNFKEVSIRVDIVEVEMILEKIINNFNKEIDTIDKKYPSK